MKQRQIAIGSASANHTKVNVVSQSGSVAIVMVSGGIGACPIRDKLAGDSS